MPRFARPPHLKTWKRDKRSPRVWIIYWSEKGCGRRVETGVLAADPDAAARAEAFFEGWKVERAANGERKPAGPGDPASVKVVDVLTAYIEHHRDDPTAQNRLIMGSRALSYFFIDDTMADLTPDRVDEFAEWRATNGVRVANRRTGEVKLLEDQEVKGSTIRRELASALRPAITHAIKRQKLADARYYFELPPEGEARDRWLTVTEMSKLLRAACHDRRSRQHLTLFMKIAIYTCARRGAILDLKWSQISWGDADGEGAHIDFNPPGRKVASNKRRAIVPIPRPLLATLRRAYQTRSCDYVVHYEGQRLQAIRAFDTAADRAGIPDATPHVLRHTGATWMAQQGVPLANIAEYLGHRDVRTTQRHYAHHSPEHMQDAKQAMENRRKAKRAKLRLVA